MNKQHQPLGLRTRVTEVGAKNAGDVGHKVDRVVPHNGLPQNRRAHLQLLIAVQLFQRRSHPSTLLAKRDTAHSLLFLSTHCCLLSVFERRNLAPFPFPSLSTPPPPPLLLVGWRTPENNGRAPPHPRTRAQRHNLPLRARCKHTAPRALEHLVGEHRLELTHSGAKRSDLVLKIKHAADALETHTLARKLGNLAKLCDVAYRVPARTAARAGRGNQTQPVVLPKGLRMHPRQLGSNRDDKHRTRCIHESLYPRALARRSSRGFSSGSCSANSASLTEAPADMCVGTTMTTSARRSPVLFAAATPRPFTRRMRPLGVPGATLSLTGTPPRVGTSIVAPSAASTNVTGTLTLRLSPSRSNPGCWRPRPVSRRSPASPPLGEVCPFPRSFTFCPSETPAGIRTVIGLPSDVCSVTWSPFTAVRKSRVVDAETSRPRVEPLERPPC